MSKEIYGDQIKMKEENINCNILIFCVLSCIFPTILDDLIKQIKETKSKEVMGE